MEAANQHFVSTKDLFPVVRDMLMQGQKVKLTVSGKSMLPLIDHNRDQVLLARAVTTGLHMGDIILYLDGNGNYLLHRIYKKSAVGYHTIGDACIREDGPVKETNILGVVEKIYRKGKVIDCSSFIWRCIFILWIKLLPVRGFLLNLIHILRQIKIFLRNLKKRLANG